MGNMYVRPLLDQIRAAFPAMTLQLAGAHTGGVDGGEFHRHVDGKPWTDLDRAYIARRDDVLSFMATPHLVQILPAFLTVMVESGSNTGVPDTLLPTLNRTQKQFDELAAALTEAQRAAVIAVLDHVAATEEGKLAAAARAAGERWKRWKPI